MQIGNLDKIEPRRLLVLSRDKEEFDYTENQILVVASEDEITL